MNKILQFLSVLAVVASIAGAFQACRHRTCYPDAIDPLFAQGFKPTYDRTLDKWGYTDSTGCMIIPPTYDQAQPFIDGLAAVELAGKWGFIDPSGNLVIPARFDMAGSFSEDLGMVKINGKRGFIDKCGNMVIPAKYDYAMHFCNGKTLV
ncbi:MAG: WG repeat-containing protein [Bacteroidales bacterium]|nr:WG repeat-containing protein [Bacteroidales bacterium]